MSVAAAVRTEVVPYHAIHDWCALDGFDWETGQGRAAVQLVGGRMIMGRVVFHFEREEVEITSD